MNQDHIEKVIQSVDIHFDIDTAESVSISHSQYRTPWSVLWVANAFTEKASSTVVCNIGLIVHFCYYEYDYDLALILR